MSVWCNCTFTAFQSLKTAKNAVFSAGVLDYRLSLEIVVKQINA